MIMRPSALAKMLSREAFTSRSVRLRPGLSTLVESDMSRRRPFSPANSPKRFRFVPVPERGFGSSLKSPVCTMRPTGVSTPKA